MNMVSEQVKKLRKLAKDYSDWGIGIKRTDRVLREAADTIEALSAKLAVENMQRSEAYYNDGWIYCGDGKNRPEEKINPVTKDFFEYQVTFECDDVSDIRHYKFGNGHWWNVSEIMDKYVTAWRVPIKPFNSHE